MFEPSLSTFTLLLKQRTFSIPVAGLVCWFFVFGRECRFFLFVFVCCPLYVGPDEPLSGLSVGQAVEGRNRQT